MKRQEGQSEAQPSTGLSRRALMTGTAVTAAGAAVSAFAKPAAPAAQPYQATPTLVIASPHKNVVETDSGKVFGAVKNGIVSFRGIPYGASTEGKNRFMALAKPQPWPGERSALYWGPVAPQPFTSTLDAPAPVGNTTARHSCSIGKTATIPRTACASTFGLRRSTTMPNGP